MDADDEGGGGREGEKVMGEREMLVMKRREEGRGILEKEEASLSNQYFCTIKRGDTEWLQHTHWLSRATSDGAKVGTGL